jgi:hypothetical protein
MSLEEKLSKVRAQMREAIPDEFLVVIDRVEEDLRNSGILDSVIKVGDKLPPFSLKNASGAVVNSADILAQGPLVLTVFRGHW